MDSKKIQKDQDLMSQISHYSYEKIGHPKHLKLHVFGKGTIFCHYLDCTGTTGNNHCQ